MGKCAKFAAKYLKRQGPSRDETKASPPLKKKSARPASRKKPDVSALVRQKQKSANDGLEKQKRPPAAHNAGVEEGERCTALKKQRREKHEGFSGNIKEKKKPVRREKSE